MMTEQSEEIVFVVDDDSSVRESLGRLFRMVGLDARGFASASEFLKSRPSDVASCLVLDIRLHGMSGLDFQSELAKANIQIPIVFITGHGDIPMSVRAMKAGAVEFLTKPFRDQDMLDAVRLALDRDRKRRDEEKAKADLKRKFEDLSPREQEIMALVTSGLMNKQIAGELQLSEVTVKVHRGHVMQKMGARMLPDLVRMADILGVRRSK